MRCPKCDREFTPDTLVISNYCNECLGRTLYGTGCQCEEETGRHYFPLDKLGVIATVCHCGGKRRNQMA